MMRNLLILVVALLAVAGMAAATSISPVIGVDFGPGNVPDGFTKVYFDEFYGGGGGPGGGLIHATIGSTTTPGVAAEIYPGYAAPGSGDQALYAKFGNPTTPFAVYDGGMASCSWGNAHGTILITGLTKDTPYDVTAYGWSGSDAKIAFALDRTNYTTINSAAAAPTNLMDYAATIRGITDAGGTLRMDVWYVNSGGAGGKLNAFEVNSVEPISAPVPEPLTMLSVFGAVAGVAGYIRRRSNR